jgi:hypothetical protein
MPDFTATTAPATLTIEELAVATAYSSNGWPAFLSNLLRSDVIRRVFGNSDRFREITHTDVRALADEIDRPTTATAYNTDTAVAMLREFADGMEAAAMREGSDTGISFTVTRTGTREVIVTTNGAEAASLFDTFNSTDTARPVITGPYGQEIAPSFARKLAGCSYAELEDMHRTTVDQYRRERASEYGSRTLAEHLAKDAKTIASVLHFRAQQD